MKYLLSTILIFIIIFGWKYYEYNNVLLPNTKDAVILVKPGQNIKALAAQLESDQIINSASVFVFWARVNGHDRKLKTGEYPLPKSVTMAKLFSIFRSGKSLGYRVVIPEGFNIYEIARAIEKAKLGRADKFLRVVRNKKLIKNLLGGNYDSLEGYLFPDTYYFTKTDSMKTMVRAMVAQFKRAYLNVGQLKGWTRHEVVTLASIIEKETGAGFERPMISSVFHNRLKKKMRLQTDPTVIYAKILRTGKLTKNIRKKDLLRQAPYNTYKVSGLPPGPIASPGKQSLKAAINPDGSPYIYFVSRNNGTHVFSKTLKEHNAAVRKFQLDRRARRGKSWRDLKKKK